MKVLDLVYPKDGQNVEQLPFKIVLKFNPEKAKVNTTYQIYVKMANNPELTNPTMNHYFVRTSNSTGDNHVSLIDNRERLWGNLREDKYFRILIREEIEPDTYGPLEIIYDNIYIKYNEHTSPGPSKLIKGTREAGYYGPVNDIITAQEIFDKTGITAGDAMMTGDITWLKFSHKGVDGKYRTLFVADRHIRNDLNWDHIDKKGYAYGKGITINGDLYKLRLIRGTDSTTNKAIENKARPGSEWDDLIVDLVPDDSISNWREKYSWCQETSATDSSHRFLRGRYEVKGFAATNSDSVQSYNGWRPVLEYIPPLISIGPGPSELVKGDYMAGYYGKSTEPNISKKAFADMLGVTEGVFTNGLTDGDSGNTDGSEKIQWLKFSHNYKTLFVADRNIKKAISWDHLEDKGVVNGLKEIEIDGVRYRVRLMVGAETNPAQNVNNTQPKGTTEWNDLIVDLVPNTSDSNWQGIYSWCQEGKSNSYSNRVRRGISSVAYFTTGYSYHTYSHNGWRPVLEVL